jgi:hypothetical protein
MSMRRGSPRMPVNALLVGAALALLVAGCVREAASTPAETWTRDGEPVSLDVISTYQGSGHCGWEKTRFLVVSRPIYMAPEGAPPSAQFVRDPDGLLGRDSLRAAFKADAKLPDDAEPTGYEREGTALWLADSDRESTAYLVSENQRTVEAWPRADPPIGCD